MQDHNEAAAQGASGTPPMTTGVGEPLAASTASPPASTITSNPRHKWPKRLAWLAGGVLFLGAASWALVPPFLKSQLEKQASEQLGRKFTVGKIDFKPWSLELSLDDVALAKSDGSAPQVQIKRIYADASIQSVRRLAPVLDALQIDGLDVKLTHLGGGKYDIDDILARLSKPPEKPVDPNAPPPGFALFNVALKGASLDFNDKTVSKTHELRALNLSVPFLSNLDTHREIKTEPQLAFKFNGSSFDSQAATTPFKDSRKTDAAIHLNKLDLKPYLAYLPASLPVRLISAELDADLKLAFEQTPRVAVKLTGNVQAKTVEIQDAAKQDLLKFDALKVTLDDVRPLEQVVKLALVELSAPLLNVNRDPTGRLNLLLQAGAGGQEKVAEANTPGIAPAKTPETTLATTPTMTPTTVLATTPTAPPKVSKTEPSTSKVAIKKEAAASDSKRVATTSDPKKVVVAPTWQIDVAKVVLQGGLVNFQDQTTQPAAQLALKEVALQADGIVWPFTKPLQFKGSAALTEGQTGVAGVAAGDGKSLGPQAVDRGLEAASLQFDGTATDQAAQVNASLGNLNLGLAAPYLQTFLVPHVAGKVAAELAVAWTPASLKISAKQVRVNNLALLDKPAVADKTDKAAKNGRTDKAAQPAQAVSGGKKAPETAPGTTLTGALASLKTLEITGTEVDVTQQTVVVGKLNLTQPAAAIERDASQRWMFERWLKSAPAQADAPAKAANAAASNRQTSDKKDAKAAGPSASGTATGTGSDVKPWAVSLKDVQLDGGQFQFIDKGVSKPVALEVTAVKVGLKDLALDGKKPFPLTVSFKLQQTGGQPGQLDYKGNLGLSPLVAQGSLVATQIPVHAFEPYFGDALNIELLRADVGFKGDLQFASGANGATVKVTGDSVLEEFRAHTVAGSQNAAPSQASQTSQAAQVGPAGPTIPPAGAPAAQNAGQSSSQSGAGGLQISEELLTWKALSLRGVDVALAPGTATQVTVAETVLTDFFARVKIDPTGRINLQDLVKSTAAPKPLEPTTNATNSVATPSASARPGGQNDPNASGGASAGAAAPVAAAPAATAVANTATGPEAVINIGPVNLINGKVFFSDQFIKPNYSANLSELNGRLSAFSSVGGQGAASQGAAPPAPTAPVMADLELRGRAEGTAALEILGKLNPLAKPLALDIKATVRDLELPPLSPYSVKYAGHAIERGKLSVDLAYLVLPSGQLDAKNKIILNQLKFGDKVEGAPASLPVRLAVALLADRNGVIDLDLPVSGSLNDPQFRLGPIIFKIIINVIVKAITAPFSLLAAAFGGGGDELSQVAFAPGSAALSSEAKVGLDKVAKALIERPALKMTVVGTSSLEEERDGFKRERLKALLQAEKRRAQVVGGSFGGTTASAATASGASTPAGAASAPAPTASAVTAPVVTVVSEAEVPALVKEIYKRSDFPKPRSPAGATKEPTLEEMQALLLANIVVTEDQIRELAVQRGVAVKDYLASKQLPVERLFLGSVKTSAGEVTSAGAAKALEAAAKPAAPDAAASAPAATEGKSAEAQAKWSPRAELNLATN